MVLLNKRNPEVYVRSSCCKCNFMIESWTHIWICKANETTITQIINEAFEKLKIKLDNLEFKIECNYHARLLYILNERSMVIFNGRIFHEAIKGIINNRLYLGINNSIFKDVIRDFVSDIKELARLYIWLPRCNEVNRWERANGITIQIKKASKCNSSFLQYVGINDKVKKKFVHDTLNRWLGIILETSDNINVIWQSTSLHDLWTYHNLVSFRSSAYASQFSVLD
jgi:hypothetical protein